MSSRIFLSSIFFLKFVFLFFGVFGVLGEFLIFFANILAAGCGVRAVGCDNVVGGRGGCGGGIGCVQNRGIFNPLLIVVFNDCS